MNFKTFGDDSLPSLMLIPGLGVSHEIFVPLIEILKDRFNIITVEIDGFTLGKNTEFTTVHDQARQAIEYIKRKNGGKIECIYGLSLGGKILSCMLERNEVVIGHAIMDAAPLLPLQATAASPWKTAPVRDSYGAEAARPAPDECGFAAAPPARCRRCR